MTGELARIVDRAVDSLVIRDAGTLVPALRELATADSGELYAELLGLILSLADEWTEDALPEADALGNPCARLIVAAIRTRGIADLQSAVGEDFGEIVTRLLATAAALRVGR